MALQRVPNLIVSSFDALNSDNSVSTIDAAGESCAVIGYVALQNGNAASKTISSAGGKIYYRTNAITFANGSTAMSIGIQDVSATTGLEDNTFDVRAALVGGVDTVTANAFMAAAMTTGTKTIAHGDLIAIVFEMTARGGADSFTVDRLSPVSSFDMIPYGTGDTGTLSKNPLFPFAMIEFDDGTVGWILGTSIPNYGRAAISYNSGSTPDEYCVTFTPTFTCEIDAVGVDFSDLDPATDTVEVILYTDPLGTPVATVTMTPDSDQTNQAAAGYTNNMFFLTPTTLTAGVTYGIAIRPTTTGNVQIGYWDLLTGNDKIRRMGTWGDTLSLASRTNQTGAFSVVQTYYAPPLYLRISKLDDGAGAGAGGGAVFGAVGGVVH